MADYITVQSGLDGSPLKIKVVSPNWFPILEQTESIENALDGLPIFQYGSNHQRFECMAKIDASPATGYASLTNIKTWRKALTTAGKDLTLVDHNGTSTSVRLAGPIAEESVSPVTPYYYVNLVFIQRTVVS